MALGLEGVRKYYDRFGSRQDSQGFYEDPAIDMMVDHADFPHASRVFELGCGTGRLAARLLHDLLGEEASYIGTDVSTTMVGLARERLVEYGSRATVKLSEGGVRLPLDSQSVDRIVSAYVLDLLPAGEIEAFFAEAARALAPGGMLCCVSLTRGVRPAGKLVAGLWAAIYHVAPMLVGGCRPIAFSDFLETQRWNIQFREVVEPYGVPSEVLIARPAPALSRTDPHE
ncbi:class I SAM-dependent methyltransferase [Salinispira pacifica]